MKTADLNQALAIARSDRALNVEDLAIFDGFGLPDFQPVTCTVEALAMLIRWQCVQFNGGIDAEALQEIAACGRRRFHVLSADRDCSCSCGQLLSAHEKTTGRGDCFGCRARRRKGAA